MADLTLHSAVQSRGMTARWMLEEVGEPYQVKMLDIQAEEQKSPAYLAINPMGKVPTLQHGDAVVTETAAICAYLADAFPDAGLGITLDSPLRGPYLRWLFFASVSAEPTILWESLGEVKTTVDYQPFADLDSVTRTLLSAVAGRQFVVGDHFTAADVMIGSLIMWGLKLAPVLPRDPALIAYWEALEARPGWQRAQAADQQYLAARSAS